MAFTVTTSTLGGNTARLITGTGNLSDLASALSTHGVSISNRVITFAGTGAATYYRMDGTLTETRDGVWTVEVGLNSFVCWSGLSTSSATLGAISASGARTSRVDIRYLSNSLSAGSDPYNSAPYRCFCGAGAMNFVAGSVSYECSTASDLDVHNTTVGCTFNNVELQLLTSGSYTHILTNANVTLMAGARFTFTPQYMEASASVTSIGSFSVDTGLRLLSTGASTTVQVQKPQYVNLGFFNSVAGAKCYAYDPASDYLAAAGEPGILYIYRTLAATFKDTLGVNIASPAPNLVTLNPGGSTSVAAFSSGAASSAVPQSYTTANTNYNTSGGGWTDYGTYSFYAVGFGYAAQNTAVNVKTAYSGNAGITWNASSLKSPLVTTAYGSVVTSGFALTTGTDTLAITTSRTVAQAAEYLFKHAYDNPADAYWLSRLHTPATQNANGYVDFGATNITITGVTYSGAAFSTTGTITLASGAICSANVVKSSGVFSAGPINNVTGLVTLTGSARWDITTGGVAHGGSAAAGNTIRVTSAAAAADFDFQAFTFNASTTFENTSGNAITLTLAAGQTAPTLLPTSGSITVVAPVVYQGLAFTGLVAGSQVKVFANGTTTELFTTSSSATSETWSQAGGFNTTVDYTVMKAGYLPIRVVGVTVNSAVVSTPVSQVVDRAYAASSGLTYGTTATVTPGTSRFAVTVATTVQNWYSFMIESWIAQSALRNVAFPVSSNGPNSFTLDGWEFSAGLSYLYRDGLRYTSAGSVAAIWAAIYSVDTAAPLQVKYQQTDGGTTVNAATTGKIDQLVQVYGDASHGNFDKRTFLALKVQKDGYDQAETDVVGTYGSLEDQLYVVGLNPVSNGLATGAPTVAGSPTITDHGASPVTWNSKAFSITITDSAAGNSGTTLMRWIRYNLGLGGTFQGKPAFDWHDLVQVNGTGFKTVRGAIYGDTGAALKGVRVLTNAGAAHPDFNLHTADDGTTYSPPQQVTIAISGVVAGSRVQIYDTANGVELLNSTSTYTFTETYTVARTLRVRIAKQSGATAYNFIEANIGSIGVGAYSLTYLASQSLDTTYNTNAIDGSTVTGITIAPSPARVAINIAGGAVTWPQIYAYQVYWLGTATGIADEAAFIAAPDTANYLLTGFDIKNTSTTPLTITGGYGRDAVTGLVKDCIDAAGSAGNIYPMPDHAIPYSSGSGLTAGQAAQLAAIPDATTTAAAVLSAATAAPIAANIKKVNGTTINGAGTAVSPWGP